MKNEKHKSWLFWSRVEGEFLHPNFLGVQFTVKYPNIRLHLTAVLNQAVCTTAGPHWLVHSPELSNLVTKALREPNFPQRARAIVV